MLHSRHLMRVEKENHIPQTSSHSAFDATKDVIGLLGYVCTLLAQQKKLQESPSLCCSQGVLPVYTHVWHSPDQISYALS